MSPGLQVALLFGAVMLGGALIAAQGPIYARMSQALGGPLPAALLAFTIGAISLLLLLLVTRTPFPRGQHLQQVPVWAWFGGLIGVYVVIVSIFAVPRLGVASYMVAVIVGQIGAGFLYDRFGAFGLAARDFTPANLIGIAMVLAGAFLTTLR